MTDKGCACIVDKVEYGGRKGVGDKENARKRE